MRLPHVRTLLLVSLAVLGQCGLADVNQGNTSFALVSPALAASLGQHAGSPAGRKLVSDADAALTRTPQPMARVHTEGTLPHKGIRDQSEAAEKDWTLMLKLGMAYRLTGDARYLQACERFMDAWLAVYKVSFNPIDETNMDEIIIACDLIRDRASADTQAKMTGFLRTMAEGYLDRIAQEKNEDAYNWQSHRIKLIVLASYALGDPDLIPRATKAFWRQVSVNIKPDGSVVDFYKRDALHYVVYDLEPLTMAALAAKAHGARDWFNSGANGSGSIEMAVDWLTPYALGEKTHVEFAHSQVKFDAARAQAGVKEYSGPWEPWRSITLYQMAALADGKYEGTLERIAPTGGQRGQEWLTLLQQAGF